jgi:hypothetical protein
MAVILVKSSSLQQQKIVAVKANVRKITVSPTVEVVPPPPTPTKSYGFVS